MPDDPRRLAVAIAAKLRKGTVRAVFRAMIRGRHDEVAARLRAALGTLPAGCDLRDEMFREWLFDALEYRISPPDDDEDGLTEPYDDDSVSWAIHTLAVD